MALLTIAFLTVLASVRSGKGFLSLAALARVLPTAGHPHSRENRLNRYLRHPGLDYRTMTSTLAPLLLSEHSGFCPLLLDQTKSGNVQALVAAVPYAGRALPIGLYTFEYPLTEPALNSQNQLEHLFLLDIEAALPETVTGVWIADRGYARSKLLHQSEVENRLYIIRGRGNTVIHYNNRRMKLKALPAIAHQAVRYENVLYHATQNVPLDVIVYAHPAYQEPWYLLVPLKSRSLLTATQVVDLYRERMQIEQSFRDFKTHFGWRGLKLQVAVSERMGRLLLTFCLAYILCVLLGDSPLGEQARAAFEIPRHHTRHGTTRTLSAFSLSMLMLSHAHWIQRSLCYLYHLIQQATQNQAWLSPSAYSIPFQRAP